MDILFRRGDLTPSEQSVVTAGFEAHSEAAGAPAFVKERFTWVIDGEKAGLQAALTADLLWDWLYIDELWVHPSLRGTGLGRRLMTQAEQFAEAEGLSGIWLWTQSWQAEAFYHALGYEEFARFEDFPKGHSRIGLRRQATRRRSG